MTTARIYSSDALRLHRLLLALGAERGERATIADVIHELIDAAEARADG